MLEAMFHDKALATRRSCDKALAACDDKEVEEHVYCPPQKDLEAMNDEALCELYSAIHDKYSKALGCAIVEKVDGKMTREELIKKIRRDSCTFNEFASRRAEVSELCMQRYLDFVDDDVTKFIAFVDEMSMRVATAELRTKVQAQLRVEEEKRTEIARQLIVKLQAQLRVEEKRAEIARQTIEAQAQLRVEDEKRAEIARQLIVKLRAQQKQIEKNGRLVNAGTSAQIAEDFSERPVDDGGKITVQVHFGLGVDGKKPRRRCAFAKDLWDVLHELMEMDGIDGLYEMQVAVSFDSKSLTPTRRFTQAEELRLRSSHFDGDFLYVFLKPLCKFYTKVGTGKIISACTLTARDGAERFEGMVESVQTSLEEAQFIAQGAIYAIDKTWESFLRRLRRKGGLRHDTSVKVSLRKREGLGGLHHVHHR